MSYQLYYAEGSAAMGVRVILEEIQAPYELIWTGIDPKAERDPELMRLNPNGWIPVLIHEGCSIYECGAIVTYLCDRYPQFNLAPAVDHPNRGLFLQWLFFFSSSIQNAYQMSYYPFRFCDSQQNEQSVQHRSISRLKELWQVVDDAIGGGDWILGKEFSAADIYLFMLITWLSDELNHPRSDEFENVDRIVSAVMQRPSVQRVYSAYIENNSNPV